jgi:hypothetical protein
MSAADENHSVTDAQIHEREGKPLRSRAGTGEIRFGTPDVATHWLCRACKQPTPITSTAAEQLESFNAKLRERGEEILDANAIVFCDSCRVPYKKKLAERSRQLVDRMALCYRELADPNSPTHILGAAEDFVRKHGEDPGAIAYFAQKRAAANNKRSRGGF